MRPLKVELQSAADRNYVLASSKYIKNINTAPKVSFGKWLSRDELVKVKAIREKCIELNSRATPLQDGRQPYVVRNGRLMSRDSNGKLQLVPPAGDNKNKSPNKPSKPTDDQSKNGQVGGHIVAP